MAVKYVFAELILNIAPPLREAKLLERLAALIVILVLPDVKYKAPPSAPLVLLTKSPLITEFPPLKNIAPPDDADSLPVKLPLIVPIVP